MAWRLYWGSATSQRVRVALVIRPRPLECRSRLLSRLPFGTPQAKIDHLSSTHAGLVLA
jgi:hypothetical protein